MKVVINEEICKEKGISYEETLACLLVKTGVNIPDLFDNMVKKEIFVKDIFGNYIITQAWDDKCMDAILTSKRYAKDKDSSFEQRLDNLVQPLREVFPSGMKEGTNSTYWRGNKRDVKLHLKKFFELYDDNYTDAQIIQAAKDYVASFNGNYTFMRALHYFIYKNNIKNGEQVSELATILENEGQVKTNNNWNVTLR